MLTTVPTVGRQVHYVSLGSAGGKYPCVCRAATVTEVLDEWNIGVAVLNPTGLFFHSLADGSLRHHGGDPIPAIGTPGARCAGGDLEYRPGTWHWPERSA